MAMVEAAGGDPAPSGSPRTGSTMSARALCGPGRRRRGHHRVRRRLGRAVRRRPGGVRGVRRDRAVAGRRAAGQAVRVRHRAGTGRRCRPRPSADPPLRPSRQPGVDIRDLRALRPARAPPARRSPRSDLFRPRDRAVLARAGLEEQRPTGVHPGLRRARRRWHAATRRLGRVRVRLAGGAGGQGSHVLSALAVADALAVIPEATTPSTPELRSSSGGSTAPDGGATARSRRYPRPRDDRPPGGSTGPARRAPAPVARRSDRPAAHGRRVRQAGDRAPRSRRGSVTMSAGDAEPRHRWRRPEGRRARRRRARRRHGRQAHERADPAVPPARR